MHYFEETPPQDGELIAAQFDDSEYADTLAETLIELPEVEEHQLDLAEDTNTVPTLVLEDGTKVYFAHIHTELPDDRTSVDVTQGFGTGMRNYILDESRNGGGEAAFLTFHRSAFMDTLEPAEFITEEGEILDPTTIRGDLLDASTCDNVGGRIVLRGVRRFIENELDATDGTSLVPEVAHIRRAIDERDLGVLETAIGELPEMIKFDLLKRNFFNRDLDEERSLEEFYENLLLAHDHATTLSKAFSPGEDTYAKLESNYTRRFAEEHAEKSDWDAITLVEAIQGTRQKIGEDIVDSGDDGTTDDTIDEDSEADGDDDSSEEQENNGAAEEDETDAETEVDENDDSGDGEEQDDGSITKLVGGHSGRGSTSDPPEPDGYEITLDDYISPDPFQSPFTEANVRYVLRCPAPEDAFEVTLRFTDSLESHDYITTPEATDDSVTVDNDKIRFQVQENPADEVRWLRFNTWIESDRRAFPDIQLDLAILPEWWYETLGDEMLDIDFEEKRFVVYDKDSIELTPPGTFGENDSGVENVDEDDRSLTVQRPMTVYMHTPIGEGPSILPFTLTPPEGTTTTADLSILAYKKNSQVSTEAIRLPLALEAIINPDRWDTSELELTSSRTSDGIIEAAGSRFEPADPTQRVMLKIEEEFINAGDPAPREFVGNTLTSDTNLSEEIGLPGNLRNKYTRLFEHFSSTETTPSTDSWGAETRTMVRDIVDTYTSVASEDHQGATYDDLRRIGTISRRGQESHCWLTPFHPLMLAYGLRIAEWRDNELLDNGLVDGFANEDLASYLSPSGLLPYRSQGSDDEPAWGSPTADHALWLSYAPIESQDPETPGFMEGVVRDKVLEFVETFSGLYEIHPDRPLTISFLNMGGLESCVEGLAQVFQALEAEDEMQCPPIEILVYGDSEQGHALDRLFSDTERDGFVPSSIDESELDTFRSKIRYTRPTELRDSQLTFFRGVLDPEFVTLSMEALPNRLLRDGLIPQESSEIEFDSRRRVYTNGFSAGSVDEKPVHESAQAANRIEWGHWNNEHYDANNKLGRSVESERTGQLMNILNHSAWAVHVQPPVGIEFYTDNEQETEHEFDPLVIHYDDTREPSPGYDLITTTNRQALYVDALEGELRQIDRDETIESERVLDILTAIEGGSVTELQRASPERITELIGMAGTLVLSRTILKEYKPDHAWIAVNLANEVQHDRARRNPRPGTLPFDQEGRASDDLMFVGIPESQSDENEIQIKLWFAEAKGGTASAASGVDQVNETIDRIMEKFNPDGGFADTEILRTAVGRIIVDSASRLQNYGLLDTEEYELVTESQERLLNGEISIAILEDRNGCRGESINIGGNELESNIQRADGVRMIEVPVDVFELLENSNLQQHFQIYDIDSEIGFD